MKILAALMTIIFCVGFSSFSGEICPDDIVAPALFSQGVQQLSNYSLRTRTPDQALPIDQSTHFCHCSHSAQIIIDRNSLEYFPRSAPVNTPRWPSSDEVATSRSTSPLYRPPIYS